MPYHSAALTFSSFKGLYVTICSYSHVSVTYLLGICMWIATWCSFGFLNRPGDDLLKLFNGFHFETLRSDFPLGTVSRHTYRSPWPWPGPVGRWWERASCLSAVRRRPCRPAGPAWCPPRWWVCLGSGDEPLGTTAQNDQDVKCQWQAKVRSKTTNIFTAVDFNSSTYLRYKKSKFCEAAALIWNYNRLYLIRNYNRLFNVSLQKIT